MNKVIILVIIIALWLGYQKQFSSQDTIYNHQQEAVVTLPNTQVNTIPKQQFQCDGRQYCSQMTSCQEAMFFLRHCPDPRMDGNNDGVPCEKQWCN